MSRMICDRKVLARVKGKVYNRVGRPAMLYWLEAMLEVTEMKMLRFSLRFTRIDKIREEANRETVWSQSKRDEVEMFSTTCGGEILIIMGERC